ncbi:MAG: PepSY-associated TM helix domain-containing protein [Acidobacteriota bacterium]
MRTLVFWVHLPLGILCGAVIAVMAVTGALLSFAPGIQRAADGPVRRVAPSPEKLPAGTLVDLAQAAVPGARATSITIGSAPDASAVVAFARQGRMFVDPHTGRILGAGAEGVRRAIEAVTGVHRWLGASEERRPAGRAVTGACNAGFLALALTGLFLWWPRRWRRAAVRPAALFQPGLSGRARDYNWHNVLGFWSSLVLVVVAGTGVVMSYRWANDLVYRLAGTAPPAAEDARRVPRQRASSDPGSRRHAPTRWAPTLDPQWERAARQTAAWRSITLRLPSGPGDSATFSIEEGTSANPFARSALSLSPDGSVASWVPYENASAGRRIRSWIRGAHTGEALGATGQTLAAAASLAAAVLVWTGFSLALRRFARWIRNRRSGSSMREAEPLEPGEVGFLSPARAAQGRRPAMRRIAS